MTRMWSGVALKAAFFGLVLAAAAPALAGTPFQVPIDQARPLSLKAAATGVVIGNPSIAGVTLQSDKLLFVTGKAYGTTNLIIVGEGGRPIYEGLVTVTGDDAGGGVVTVTRGLTTIRQSCNPVCRKTPDIADDPDAFNEANSQVTSHAARAGGGK
ncbi:MAG TPA: pilus assembly protein N-terminal domain-containing protein [Caulobacterales bacterium]|nr:pilus assembly protein N-terminal domain-containing protein [Caulobacterales bacterium]